MINSELHNFIEDYVCQDNNDIQWSTACRYEFNELISRSDKAEKKGRFFHHQELFCSRHHILIQSGSIFRKHQDAAGGRQP